MSEHLSRLRELSVLAARSPEDARHIVGVLGVAAAVENIADPPPTSPG